MKKFAFILPVMALAMSSGCVVVSSETATKKYDLTGFDSISARSGVNVVLKQGPFDISAKGPKEKLDRLQIEKQGSQLVISRESAINVNWIGWSQPDIVTVSAPDYVS